LSCLTATAIGYQRGAKGWSSTTSSTGISSSGVVAPIWVDLNSDGLSDLLYPIAESGSTSHWWVSFATASGYETPINTNVVTNNGDTIITGLFSGSMQMQILVPQGGSWSLMTYAASRDCHVCLNTV
jgi:hypothetical protein